MLKHKINSQQGFTMVEVLISILVATTFVLVSGQALVLGAWFRVRAEQTSEANRWIKEQLEIIDNLALSYAQDDTKCSASSYNDGYAKGLSDNLDGSLTNPSFDTILNKQFRINRTYPSSVSGNSDAPHMVLKIRYEVQEWNGSTTVGSPIATDYKEVIPNAAFLCP